PRPPPNLFPYTTLFRSTTKAQDTPSLTGPLTPKQVGVRPRVLTVNRRNPDEAALRVLHRFSFTERDTFAQYDKLVSAYDVADWRSEEHTSELQSPYDLV